MVNTSDQIVGKIERWEAHKKAVLHRAFTIALIWNNKFVCQQRKHPLFDKVLDLTASSHTFYENDKLKNEHEVVMHTLNREWGIPAYQLNGKPKLKGKVYYKSYDGSFWEHEVCRLYVAKINVLPNYDPEYAYGMSLLSQDEIYNYHSDEYPLSPWVTEIINKNLL